MRLSAVDRHAETLGLGRGLALADARARVPDIAVHEEDGEADLALLAGVADWCERYTPIVADSPPHGLVLEIAGSLPLFGGEQALFDDLAGRLDRFGLKTRAAIASTVQCARAVARFGRDGIVARGTEKKTACSLPVAAMECGGDIVVALRRAGLNTIGDLAQRPRKPLAARFGTDFVTALSGILGETDRPVTARRPPPFFTCEARFPDPIGLAEDIEAALSQLAERLCLSLEEKGKGGRVFEAAFFRADGATRRLHALSGRPLREPRALKDLFMMRLDGLSDPLDPGFGFDAIRLSVIENETFAHAQCHIDGRNSEEEAIADLIGRLTTRFGAKAIERFEPLDSHMPERAVRGLTAISRTTTPGAWASPSAGEPPMRPILLFTPPQPVETLAEVPDGPPLRFRWRRMLHDIVRMEGPERIAPEWWRNGSETLSRDYYRVEDAQGYRFWLFRHGVYGRETGRTQWYIHGLFA